MQPPEKVTKPSPKEARVTLRAVHHTLRCRGLAARCTTKRTGATKHEGRLSGGPLRDFLNGASDGARTATFGVTGRRSNQLSYTRNSVGRVIEEPPPLSSGPEAGCGHRPACAKNGAAISSSPDIPPQHRLQDEIRQLQARDGREHNLHVGSRTDIRIEAHQRRAVRK